MRYALNGSTSNVKMLQQHCTNFKRCCKVGAKNLYLKITALTILYRQQINITKHIDNIQKQVDSTKHDFEDNELYGTIYINNNLL